MRRRRCSLILKVVLLGSFFLLLPFGLFGGSGSFDLCGQSVDVKAVVFGAAERSRRASTHQLTLRHLPPFKPDAALRVTTTRSDEKLLNLHFLSFPISPPGAWSSNLAEKHLQHSGHVPEEELETFHQHERTQPTQDHWQVC